MSGQWNVLMKFALLLLIVPSTGAIASGMTLHLFIADLAQERLLSPRLKTLLERFQNAYRNGSVFPDTGYAIEYDYGEFAHWHDFLNTYQTTLFDQCPDPESSVDCGQAWSHFYGSLSHSLADIRFDRYFLTQAAIYDFSGDIDQAQKLIDPGCDFLAIFDHRRAFKIPDIKQQPYQILSEVLNLHGFSVTIPILYRGAKRHKLGFIGEPLGTPFTYLYYKNRMPWTSKNYYHAKGGINDTAQRIAVVWDHVWQRLQNQELALFESRGNWPNVSFFIDGIPLEEFGLIKGKN